MTTRVRGRGCMANCWCPCSGKSWNDSGAIFPPGATDFQKRGNGSAWRVFSFGLHALQQAIEPAISLQGGLDQWNQLEMELRERKRQRIPRINFHSSLSYRTWPLPPANARLRAYSF